MNPIESIMKFQRDRCLDVKEFDILNEATNIINEVIESTGYSIDKENRDKLSEMIELLFTILQKTGISNKIPVDNQLDKDECSVDAFADIIVFSISAIMKLGYDPIHILDEVSKEINSRSGTVLNGMFVATYRANYKKMPKQL